MAGAIAFSGALRRGDASGEEEGNAIPAAELATVLPAEGRADWIASQPARDQRLSVVLRPFGHTVMSSEVPATKMAARTFIAPG